MTGVTPPRGILISSIGSGVGRAVIQSTERSGHHYQVIGTSTVAIDTGRATIVACPPTSHRAEFERTVLATAEQYRPSLVLAGRDEDAEALVDLTEPLSALGAIVPSGPGEAVRAACDKALTSWLLPTGMFAKTASDLAGAQAIAARAGWPLVVKPRHGFASRGVRIAVDPEGLDRLFGPDDIAQELLVAHKADRREWEHADAPWQSGDYSLQILLGPSSDLLGAFCSRNELANGRPVRVETIPVSAISGVLDATVEKLRLLRATGPWNLQGRRVTPTTWRFFEANARLTGISGMRAFLGFNEVDALFAAFVLGERRSALPQVPPGLVIDARPWTDPPTALLAKDRGGKCDDESA